MFGILLAGAVGGIVGGSINQSTNSQVTGGNILDPIKDLFVAPTRETLIKRRLVDELKQMANVYLSDLKYQQYTPVTADKIKLTKTGETDNDETYEVEILVQTSSHGNGDFYDRSTITIPKTGDLNKMKLLTGSLANIVDIFRTVS
jgi:hypothetical protein